MNPYIRFPLVLLIISAVAGSALYGTYITTKEAISQQEKKAREEALTKVFPGMEITTEAVTEGKEVLYIKVWQGEKKSGKPDYYAAMGKGTGYNSAVPIELLAGFTNPEKPGPKSGGREKAILVGWSVTKSEETPGLGEKIKESKAPYTLIELVTHSVDEDQTDLRTGFQKQFADPESDRTFTAEELKLSSSGGEIDVITGATYTSRGVVKAIQDAGSKIAAAIKEQDR